MPGVEIEAVGFGNTSGCTVINPGDPYEYNLYTSMFDTLERAGYVPGTTLRVASYDWRLFGDKCWTPKYFSAVTSLIESTSAKHGGPVRLMCHSMGCPVAHAFLAKHVSDAWKATHITDFLAMAPSFGGAGSAVPNWISGPKYVDFLPVIVSNFGRTASGSWPSLVSLLPVNVGGAHVWDDDVVFVST